MSAPWPFAQWGLDIRGPFPIGAKQLTFLVVGIDYFTKWVEAEALASITEKKIRSFVWTNIICRFGIPEYLSPTTESNSTTMYLGVSARN